MSKKLLVLSLMLLAGVMVAQATTYITGMNWDSPFTLPYPTIANDYHVKGVVRSAGNVMPTLNNTWCYDYVNGTSWYLNGYSIHQDPANPSDWIFELDFKTANGGFVFNGAICHFGVEFKTNRYNYLRMLQVYWTYNGRNIGNARVTGFHMWEHPARGPIVSLRNDLVNQEAIEIAQLQLAVTDVAIPLEAMARNDVGLPGKAPNKAYADIKWVDVPQSIRLEPGKSVELDVREFGLNVAENQFIQVRFVDPATNTGTWMQHQHTTIPEEVQ